MKDTQLLTDFPNALQHRFYKQHNVKINNKKNMKNIRLHDLGPITLICYLDW